MPTGSEIMNNLEKIYAIKNNNFSLEDQQFQAGKRHQFDAFCKKVLRNEARDIYNKQK